MHPTILGLLLFPCAIAVAQRPVRLIELGLIAGVFAAAAAVVIGGFGLQPALVPCLVLVVHVLIQYASGRRYPADAAVLRTLAPLLVLLVYALLSVILLPGAFAGQVMVAPQKLARDSPWLVPLAFNSGNVTQPMYLACDIAVAVAAGLVMTSAKIPYDRLIDAYLFSGYVVVSLMVWQFLARTTGLFFPKALLYSNPGWTIVDQSIGGMPRLQGPFSEPAALSTYLVGLSLACMILVARGYRSMRPPWLLGLALAATLLSTSTTGIAALILDVPAAMLVLASRKRRFPLARVTRSLTLIAVTGILLFGVLAALKPAYLHAANTLIDSTLAKQQSSSYTDRTALDAAALATLGPTGGLGVGWGSFRASSLIPGLLANGGIPGLACVIWLILAVRRLVSRASTAAPQHPGRLVIGAFSAALCGQLSAAVLSAPTIDSSAFFLELGCVAGVATRLVTCRDTGRRSSRSVPVSHTDRRGKIGQRPAEI